MSKQNRLLGRAFYGETSDEEIVIDLEDTSSESEQESENEIVQLQTVSNAWDLDQESDGIIETHFESNDQEFRNSEESSTPLPIQKHKVENRWTHDKFFEEDSADSRPPRRKPRKAQSHSNFKHEKLVRQRERNYDADSDLNVGKFKLTLKKSRKNSIEEDAVKAITSTIKDVSLKQRSPSRNSKTSEENVEPPIDNRLRPQISQKAKMQLLASMDRKQKTIIPDKTTIKIPASSNAPKSVVDAPEFIPSGFIKPINNDMARVSSSNSFTEKDAPTMIAVQPMMTNTGHYVLMTENGLMVPADYLYAGQYYTGYDQSASDYGQANYNVYAPPYGYTPPEQKPNNHQKKKKFNRESKNRTKS